MANNFESNLLKIIVFITIPYQVIYLFASDIPVFINQLRTSRNEPSEKKLKKWELLETISLRIPVILHGIILYCFEPHLLLNISSNTPIFTAIFFIILWFFVFHKKSGKIFG